MNFRTKIWTLPLSATGVFVIGVAVCVLLGARISSGLEALQSSDSPYLEELAHIERNVEQYRQTLQAAAVEGDDSKLTDAEALAAAARKSIGAIAQLDGHADTARQLSASLDVHTASAVEAVNAMLKKAEMGELLTRMQSAQGAFDELLKAQQTQARTQIAQRFDGLNTSVKASIGVTILTGLVALLVLGFASWVIIKSVWRDLGGEPTRLRELVRQVADGDLEVQVPVEPGDTGSLNAAMAGMALFISSYTRCGLAGTLSKWVLRCRVRLRSRQDSTQALRSFSLPAAFHSRAISRKAFSALPASETMPRSGLNTRPICVGSMSTWMNLRPSV